MYIMLINKLSVYSHIQHYKSAVSKTKAELTLTLQPQANMLTSDVAKGYDTTVQHDTIQYNAPNYD